MKMLPLRAAIAAALLSVAVGVSAVFIETHPDPARALSDAATQWPLDQLTELLDRTLDLWARARAPVGADSSLRSG